MLPAVENRWVTLIAATTENPHFAVIAPLMSRSVLLTLRPLEADGVRAAPRACRRPTRAALARSGLSVDDDTLDQLTRLSGGDARWGLTALEAAAAAA